MKVAIGVDVGGSSAKIGLVNAAGEILNRHRVPTPTVDTPDAAFAVYLAGIRAVLAQSDPSTQSLTGVGVGMPGQINPDRLSATASNVPILDDFPLVERLSTALGVPAQIDNDATVAAIAEYHYGAGQGFARLLTVTMGTGIGLGMVVDGAPQRPTRGCMGDPGHIIVDAAGRWQCNLGCWGCLETVASSHALEREAMAAASWSPETRLGTRLKAGGRLSAADVIEAASTGDAQAISLIEQVGIWLGIGLTSWCHSYAPDGILIGGGLSAAGELLLGPAREKMRRTGMSSYVEKPPVDLAALGNDAGIVGAASLILHA